MDNSDKSAIIPVFLFKMFESEALAVRRFAGLLLFLLIVEVVFNLSMLKNCKFEPEEIIDPITLII